MTTKIVPIDETCSGASPVIDEGICNTPPIIIHRPYGKGLYGVGKYSIY